MKAPKRIFQLLETTIVNVFNRMVAFPVVHNESAPDRLCLNVSEQHWLLNSQASRRRPQERAPSFSMFLWQWPALSRSDHGTGSCVSVTPILEDRFRSHVQSLLGNVNPRLVMQLAPGSSLPRPSCRLPLQGRAKLQWKVRKEPSRPQESNGFRLTLPQPTFRKGPCGFVW